MLPPHLLDLIAREQENRAIAWLDVTPDLCGVSVRHLTARMRNDLVLARNAFMIGGSPTANDVFNFLWRLSPHFAHPRNPAALRRRGPRLWCLWRTFGSLRTASHFYVLERHVARLSVSFAAAAIVDRLTKTFQDRPASSGEEAEREATGKNQSLLPGPVAPWLDDLVEFFTTRKGWQIDEVLDQPLQRLFQIHRAMMISMGARPIDPSQAVIGEWIFSEASRLRSATA